MSRYILHLLINHAPVHIWMQIQSHQYHVQYISIGCTLALSKISLFGI